jgi:hypothetical protein
MFELDHLFVCTDVGAPEAEQLIKFGLTEGQPNVHPGQGTANRRFFFHNAMLELVWVQNPAEAQSEPIRPTQLWPRWSQRRSGACPFGVGLRPARPGSEGVPFPAWEYRPPYLPPPLAIHVGEDTPPSEPMWFYLGFVRRPGPAELQRLQPLGHAVGFQRLTQVRLLSPSAANLSEVARAVARAGILTMAPATEHLLEMTFDGGPQGRGKDFRPDLPLVFRW